MKNLTVKELNRYDFSINEYDNYYLNLDELFYQDNKPTRLEFEVAQLIMEELKIDDDTEIIEFRATTSILVSFILNLNTKVSNMKLDCL
jgi:hypothetical protein